MLYAAFDDDIVGVDEAAALTLNVSCVAQAPHDDVVTALVTWRLPASATTSTSSRTWNSTVLVEQYTPDGLMHMKAHRSSSNHVQLSLTVDHIYIIAVISLL